MANPKTTKCNENIWQLALDPKPCRYSAPPADYPLTMTLPGTTAQQQIGTYHTEREEGFFTEKYPFEGQIWLRRTYTLTAEQQQKAHCFLYLERTRMTKVFVNGTYVGEEKSLSTPHIYDLSAHIAETMEIVICVKNFDYPTRGGHMTSPDTQTNWIGVTGECSLRFCEDFYISDLQVDPDAANREVTVRGVLHGTSCAFTEITLTEHDSTDVLAVLLRDELRADADGSFAVTLRLPDSVRLWSEYDPALYCLRLDDAEAVCFGLRDFKACGDHFEVNGVPTMLRGKHDGLVFPRTGAAPTDVETWLNVFHTMKDWGINHYRFHTCCPPEAAFTAADLTGIYMEPELPFWGTVHALDDKDCNPDEQAYLVREGLRICKAFGNHPSFCMLSLGNELWGSPERLGDIICTLRKADPRPLYTQGSNNFQHMPLQIPQEDFWTGVRTGFGKLIRGSFADCDAPIGRIQTDAPSASWDYEQSLAPQETAHADIADGGETEIEIQYGTGVKKVKAAKLGDAFVPTVPVVTHEVGQYNVYPDYREIETYKADSVVEARNFEIFRERLEAAGMGDQAEQFFRCSGAFSRDCYKADIEAAMRSPHVAGFQLLDLQDFPGQGTALVGMLNARLENKGFIQPRQWRAFCGDLVPLAVFDSFVWTQGASVTVRYAVRCTRPALAAQTAKLIFTCGTQCIETEVQIPANAAGFVPLGAVTVTPEQTGRAELRFVIPHQQIENKWELTVMPQVRPVQTEHIRIAHSMDEALPLLQNGGRVLLLPDKVPHAVRGFYCTDFWNYHMFRLISESMGRQEPVGTMGLCIDTAHPIAQAMCSAEYSTPQWYMPVTHADCTILDDMPRGYRPIVQMIDNVERNHRLGLIYEANVSGGRLLVCTVRFDEAPDDPAMNRLYHAVIDYMQSDAFAPETEALPEQLL